MQEGIKPIISVGDYRRVDCEQDKTINRGGIGIGNVDLGNVVD